MELMVYAYYMLHSIHIVIKHTDAGYYSRILIIIVIIVHNLHNYDNVITIKDSLIYTL